MKIAHAKAQRGKPVLRLSFALLRLCGEKLVAIALALSFFALLAPIASASRDKSNAMPCCAGKAGHCDSGITPKKLPQPKSEPMCGLKTDAEYEDDGITIVAETSDTETSSTSRAAESAAVDHQPCPMDCGACATGASQQQKRERAVVQSNYQSSSLTTLLNDEYLAVLFPSNADWDQTRPRGPPSALR